MNELFRCDEGVVGEKEGLRKMFDYKRSIHETYSHMYMYTHNVH
jgi:hypothetical protein